MTLKNRLGLVVLVAAPIVLLAAPVRPQEDPAAKPAQAEQNGAPAADAGAAGEREGKDPAASRVDDIDRTPEDCIGLTSIRQTKVVDNSTILFYMRNGTKIYRNTLPRECPELAHEDRFAYKTTVSRLCDVDLITVLQQFGAELHEGFTCRLGKFVPISREEADDLVLAQKDLGRTRDNIKSKPAKTPDEKKADKKKGGEAPKETTEEAPQ